MAILAVRAIAAAIMTIFITTIMIHISKIAKLKDDKAVTFILVIGAIVAIRVIMVITCIIAVMAITTVIAMMTIINITFNTAIVIIR